jgi:hypothetical protein
MFSFDLPNIFYKTLEIYKEDLTNKIIDNILPILVKALKYYGLYQVLEQYYGIISNLLIAVATLIIVIVATNSITTNRARPLLIVLIMFNTLLEIFFYIHIARIIKIVIRSILFCVAIGIYLLNHFKFRESQCAATTQQSIVYNVVVNNNYGAANVDVDVPKTAPVLKGVKIDNVLKTPMTQAMKDIIEKRNIKKINKKDTKKK